MSSNKFDRKILDLVNQERNAAGLDSLAIDSQLDTAANLHTDEMVQADRMSHQLPGEAGLGDRVSNTGYDWSRLAENVAAGYTTPESVVEGWMNSPKHRENILNPQFTEIGIGYEDAPDEISNNGDYDTYWTQVFGNGVNSNPNNDDVELFKNDSATNSDNGDSQIEVPQVDSNDNDTAKVDNPLPSADNNSNESDTDYKQEILELVNQERADAGLDSLAIDSQLNVAADLHTDEMVQADRMSHQLPGEVGLGDRVSNAGYDWSRLAENVAAGYSTPESVVEGWMNSPGHRANILEPQFTEIGIGYENASDDNNSLNDYDTYFTQVFGTEGFSNS